MATIAKTQNGAGVQDLAVTTLDGTSDTFVYDATRAAFLILKNPTGGAISPVIDGDGATSVPVGGVGSVDISAGFAVGSIAAGETKVINLAGISAYLAGTIDIASGTGLEASILEI